MAPGRHFGFYCSPKWHHGTLRAVHGHQHTKFGEDIWNSGWVMAIFVFSKWRPAAILVWSNRILGTPTMALLAVLSVLSNFILIWLIVSKTLKIQFVLRLAWNCLTTPTFWGFYRFLITCTIFLIKTLKSHIIGWIRVVWDIDREIVKIRPPVFAVGDDKKKIRESITQFRVIFHLLLIKKL